MTPEMLLRNGSIRSGAGRLPPFPRPALLDSLDAITFGSSSASSSNDSRRLPRAWLHHGLGLVAKSEQRLRDL